MKKIYSMYDSAAQLFLTPMFLPTEQMAIRALSDEMRNPDSTIVRHHQDYAMYYLGIFNDDDGTFDVATIPQVVVRATALLPEAA